MCNLLQDGLPVCRRPFAGLAEFLNSSEREVLQQTEQLKTTGVIRRICALIDYRALGMTGTLVAAHIRQENLQEIADAVNSLENVSHNYLRKHHYNLWFTLQAESAKQIELILSNLSGRFGVDFHSLPVERVFKLDVRFDAVDDRGLKSEVIGQKNPSLRENLSSVQKLILSKLQNDLKVIARPFDFLCSESLETEKVLRIIQELIDKGVVRRIAAVVDHRKLGFAANVLFCCELERGRVVEAGKRLARFGTVTHCYQRKTFEGWPYNLFAMMHGKTMGDVQRVIDRFTKAEKIDSFELLPTTAELKKQPVKHRFW